MKGPVSATAALCILSLVSASCRQQPETNKYQQVTVTVSMQDGSQTDDMQLFIYPLGLEYDDDTPMKACSDGTFSQSIPSAPRGLYSMVYIKGTAQYSLPVFFMATQDSIGLELCVEGECPTAQIACNYRHSSSHAVSSMDALNRFNALYYSLSRKIWTEAESMDVQGLKDMISEYCNLEKSISGDRKVSESVKGYIKVWSYLQSFESCTVFNRLNGQKVDIFSGQNALLCPPHKVLDSEFALFHQAAPGTAAQAVPKGGLDGKLGYVNDHYTNEEMRASLQRNILNSYIRSYSFSNGYEDGLETLNAAKDAYGIDQSYIDAFMERVSSTPGAPFPNVTLVNSDGETVSIDMFRGKYVYVDLWASWCIPCCKEVPYLQALEREMRGSDIVFVSISVDESESAWREKMSELGMHGNQWRNSDDRLCDKLNVSGIPHFLIYDRDGKLHTYNAPRPSSGSAFLKELLAK